MDDDGIPVYGKIIDSDGVRRAKIPMFPFSKDKTKEDSVKFAECCRYLKTGEVPAGEEVFSI